VSYTTVMVHLKLGQSNAYVLRVASELAERFESRLIGIAAAQPIQFNIGDGYISGDLIEQERDEIAEECKKVELEFHTINEGKQRTSEWRSTTTCSTIAAYVAQQARSADLIVTAVATQDAFDAQRQVKLADLLMQAGRPLLIVPDAVNPHSFNSVVIAWKDTRETRRAIVDALPLLKLASHISVVEIAVEGEINGAHTSIEDVCAWLRRHDIDAIPIVSESRSDDERHLQLIAQEQSADVIVAGAYGHSRLHEWALGGMTRALSLQEKFLAFLSH